MTAAALTLFVLTALAPVAWLAADRATRDRHLFGLLPSTVASLLRAVGLVVLAGLASATAIVATAAGPATGLWAHAAPVIAAAAAVTGGGPIVRAVLALGGVRPAPAADDSADEDPESTTEVGPLRGGRVIGYLERLAVVSTLMAGWPEGLAIILAVKGLARYPELRAPQASEQFIMGTFVSVLWAIGMAGIEHLLTN